MMAFVAEGRHINVYLALVSVDGFHVPPAPLQRQSGGNLG